jgi:hypothetical protein
MNNGDSHPVSSGSVAYAMSTLEDQAMPSEEIAAMVRAHDPELVRRYLELHRERLEERLACERRTVDQLEGLLIAEWSGSSLDPDLIGKGRHDQGREQHHHHPGR